MNWSNTKIIEFLNEIRIHPEVWNVKSDVYKNREAKRDGWESIAEKFGVSSEEAYKKFKSLRTYAKNEEKKNKGADKPVKWFAYDAISFILNEEADTGLDGVNTVKKMENRKSRYISADIEDIDIIESEATGSSFSSVASKRPRISQKLSTPDYYVPKPRSTMTGPVEQSEYAAFGAHVAYKLSRYDAHTRAQAEMKIAQVLYDCDLQALSQAEELVPLTVLGDAHSE